MTAFRSMGAALETDGSGTEPKDVRKDLTGLFANPGVIPGGDAPLVAGTSGAFSYQVGRCNLVSSRGVSDGYHLWGNDGTVTLTTADDGSSLNAPGSGSRIDIVYGLHPSNGENTDTTSQPYFAVRKGTAAPSPSAPSLPTGAVELARNTMTASATSTGSTGNSIAQTAAVVRPRTGQYRLTATQRPSGATGGTSGGDDTAIFTSGPFVSPSGSIRLHVMMRLEATAVGALYLVRLRQNSATGAQLAAWYVWIDQISRGTSVPAAPDIASVTPGASTNVYLTVQRITGTGAATVSSDSKIIVDEDPA